jgi:hypothetical protein
VTENQGAVAPDGSPLALYLALPGEDEAAIVHGAILAGARILELGSGPGRMTRPLLHLGHDVTAVDNQPFTAHEIDIDAMAAGAGLLVDAVLDEAATWTRLVPA